MMLPEPMKSWSQLLSRIAADRFREWADSPKTRSRVKTACGRHLNGKAITTKDTKYHEGILR
jgi:hypothetical protein